MARQVATFLDIDNIHWGLSNFYGANTEEMILQMIDKIWDIYKDDKVRIFSTYADFERVPGIQTEIQRKRVTTKHVSGSGHRDDMIGNAVNIELSLDALETLIKFPDIDYYAITSADKNMIPLMNRLNYYGKSVHLFFLDASIAADSAILDYADEAISLELLLGLEPTKTKIGSIELEANVLQAVSLVNSFYLRNVEKPEMYLGRGFFITEAMTILKLTRQNANDLLELCLNNGYLSTALTEDKNEKIIVPTTVELVMAEVAAQITSNGKSK
ncbi:MAG: NYN domain-containing protein [Syntrophomonadaceae bacterium]|nr:NYN domain-containing protein [Syntrophomonadaceae bacterium]